MLFRIELGQHHSRTATWRQMAACSFAVSMGIHPPATFTTC
jgi:hypothetical protein